MRIAALLVVPTLALVACGNGSGGRCASSTECQTGLVCITANATTRLCMRLCDRDAGDGAAQHLCSDGSACLTLEGMPVCYVGGDHAITSACAVDTECEPGTICAPDTHLCEQACTLGNDHPCRTTESCIDVGGGLCRARALTVDGGT